MELLGYFTTRGTALSVSLLTGAALHITRVAAGSGETDLSAVAMAVEAQALAVSPLRRSGSTVTLPATLTAAQAEADYTLTEVGVYAMDGEEEILYRLYRLDEPVRIPAGDRLTLRLELQETVSEATEVTVAGTATGLLTEEDLDLRLGVPDGIATLNGSGKVPADQLPAMDFAPSSHTHVAGDVTSGTFAAARIPTLAASKVTSGTFAATEVKAKVGTDYTTARVRNIQASTTDLTAGTSSLANGDLYFVYE